MNRRTLIFIALVVFPAVLRAAPDPAAALLQADADFCQLCIKKGMSASFLEYMAPDGVMLAPGEAPIVGTEAIRAAMAGTEKLELTWTPLKAEIAASGEMGYTYGTSEMKRPGPDGTPVVTTGKYMTVWRKQSDGTWKATVDIGNRDPAPTKAP